MKTESAHYYFQAQAQIQCIETTTKTNTKSNKRYIQPDFLKTTTPRTTH